MKPPACLANILRVAEVFDRDINVISDDDGWSIRCMDPAHTASSVMHIPVSSFGEGYEPWGEFCLRIKDVKAHLSKTEDISMVDGSFYMKGKGWTRRMGTYLFEGVREIAKMPMSVTALLDVDLIRPVLDTFDPKEVQEVSFTAAGDSFTIESADDKYRNAMTVSLSSEDMVELTEEDPSVTYRAAYALDYWQDFIKALPKATLVEISFQDDYPACVDFSADGMEGRWMIAPRISED